MRVIWPAAKEPGHMDEKWATETRRHKWARDENRGLLECYYASKLAHRGERGICYISLVFYI